MSFFKSILGPKESENNSAPKDQQVKKTTTAGKTISSVSTKKKVIQPPAEYPKRSSVAKPTTLAPFVQQDTIKTDTQGLIQKDITQQPVKPVGSEPIAVPTESLTSYSSYDPTQFPTTTSFFKKFKKLVDTKLTILLIESSSQVANENEMLMKIIKSLVTTGKVCFINYGTDVIKSDIFNVTDISDIILPASDLLNDNKCLFDALIELEKLVSQKHMSIEETDTVREMINEIEIIGIGTCKDNGSKTSKEDALNAFYRAVSLSHVSSKYFCLTEENFIEAAEIGFHSIGAIFRNYQ